MPYPPTYNRQFNFQNQQSLTPADPLPADEIDSEYNAIKLTLDATTANLQLIQRSDGALANESVGVDQLTPDIALLGNSAAEILAAAAAVEIAAAGVEGSEAAAAGSASSASSSATTASAAATAAQTAKTAAETAELNAEAAETTANISKTQAQAAALDAVAAAAKLTGASSTSTVIGTGSKTFTTDPGKFFDAGTWLLITSNANPAVDYMHGVATAYASTTLTVNVTNIGGSGTLADWTIRVAGTQGAQGVDGAAGAPGIQFEYATSTVDSDPGSGAFRFNNSTIASATALYVDNEEFNGVDVSTWLSTFDDTGASDQRGTLRVVDPEAPNTLYIFKVTGSVVDGTGYQKLTVTYESGSGAFVAGIPYSFAFFPTGLSGPQGPPGSGTVLSDGDYGDIVVSGTGTVLTIDAGVVTLAKQANIATDSLIGRDTAATGAPEVISVGGGVEFSGTGAIRTTAFTGDVTKTAGGTALTIANDAVTYAKLQNVSVTSRLLGRITAGAGDAEELTGTQVTTLLDNFTSTLKGLVPLSGGGTANFLRADGTWAAAGGAVSSADRQNFALNTIYQAKTFGGYRKLIDMFADGYKASDGIAAGSSSNYAVDVANGRVAPTSATTRVSSGVTPTMPLGGTAANINDNSAGTTATTSNLGNLTGAPTGSRIFAKLDLGSVKTVTKIELLQSFYTPNAAEANNAFWYSTDNTNWTQAGSNFSITGAAGDDNVVGSFSARYVAVTVVASDWTGYTVTMGDMNAYTDVSSNATIVTTAQTVSAARTLARGLVEYNPIDAITLNTDLTVELSCNGGTNWTAATLTAAGIGQAGRLVAETAEVTCTSGTSIQARVKSFNNKSIQIYGTAIKVAA